MTKLNVLYRTLNNNNNNNRLANMLYNLISVNKSELNSDELTIRNQFVDFLTENFTNGNSNFRLKLLNPIDNRLLITYLDRRYQITKKIEFRSKIKECIIDCSERCFNNIDSIIYDKLIGNKIDTTSFLLEHGNNINLTYICSEILDKLPDKKKYIVYCPRSNTFKCIEENLLYILNSLQYKNIKSGKTIVLENTKCIVYLSLKTKKIESGIYWQVKILSIV